MLVACAHGTRSSAGASTVAALVEAVRARRPSLDVRLAFVDVAEPALRDVVSDASGPLVVVPVLLSRGYHVRVDIPGVLAARPDATASVALGPDRAVSTALAERLSQARGRDQAPADGVVLVATGSSDPDAALDLSTAADDLAAVLGRPVRPAVLSGPGPALDETLADLLADVEGPVDVAAYLLAEGVFHDRLRRDALTLGARCVAAPMGAHPALVELILARYDGALADRAERPAAGR